MRITRKTLILTLLTFNLIVLIPLNFYHLFSFNLYQNNPSIVGDQNFKEFPKDSSEHVLSNRIHIKSNWTETNSTYDWCTGSGTIFDPFVIDNVRIVDQIEGAFIKIENSKDYFIISNCILSDFIGNMFYGIFLKNVSNGIIYNNTISFNFRGIFVMNCSHISVISNYLDNDRYGIYSTDSNYIRFLSNTIIDSTYFGIYSRFCSFSNISENIIQNNDINPLDPAFDRYIAIFGYVLTQNLISNNSIVNFNEIHEAIYLTASSNNTIFNNSVINSEYGVNLDLADHNTVISNKINNCIWGIILNGDKNNLTSNQMINCGIVLNYLGFYSQFIDSTNLANNKPIYYYESTNDLTSINFLNAGQVILVNCSNSLIAKSDVSQSSIGIYLDSCSNNSISYVNSSHNQYGIFIWECVDIEIKDCFSNMNMIHGVSIRYGTNARIINNHVNYNGNHGINTYNFDNIQLRNNSVSNNLYDGISIERCENASIIYNTVNNNGIRGIFLNSVENSTISFNNVKRNHYDGLQMAFSQNNIIKSNNFYNNVNGIHLSYNSIHNIIMQNILFNNQECFYQDESSENNFYYGNICGNTRLSTKNIITILVPMCIILLFAFIFREKRP